MNRNLIIAILAFFVIGFLLGTQLHGCKYFGAGQTVTVRADTVIRFVPRIDTQWHTIQLRDDVPYTVWGHDTIIAHDFVKIQNHDTFHIPYYSFSSDTVAYADTIRQDKEFKAEIFDTLANNRIIGRSLKWALLDPIKVRDITKTVTQKPSLVKVYVGAEAYGGKSAGKVNVDLAPAASLVFADRYMVDLGYYIFNQQFTAGLKVKLSFRKHP